MREAAKDLLGPTGEGQLGQWYGWLIAAFLLGAATGGFVFGRLGDRFGRARAMALSILCYSLLSCLSALVTDPWQLLALRFLTCMGIGGMWPNGIALVSEAWPDVSRPILAGAIGTAANVGIMLFAILTIFVHVTVDSWQWAMWVGGSPCVLGLFALAFVPESPKWLAIRRESETTKKQDSVKPAGAFEIFRPPLLKTTVLGIALGTIPLFGGWGSSNWATAWASQVGEQPTAETSSDADANEPTPAATKRGDNETTEKKADPGLKSRVALYRSLPGSVSSLLGGALAWWIGRRLSYFLLSVAALGTAQYLFWFSHPSDPSFLWWTAALGLFSGFYFGWLPLCLPEMFPTRVRSTGAGVSFNFGRILTAVGVLGAGAMLKEWFDGDYAQIGRITSFIYGLGMVIILFAPDTSKTTLDEEGEK
jgi:hypothetical protein